MPISSANLNGPATRWAYWRKLDGYQPGWQPGWQAGPDGTFFVHGDYKPFDGQPCNGRPFCDGYQPFDPGNQPFDPDVWYDGDVD